MSSDRRGAGWYSDEDDPVVERWWNGTQWTTHTRAAGCATELADLEGSAPRAWSTADDHALATVDEPYRPVVVRARPTRSARHPTRLVSGPGGASRVAVVGRLDVVRAQRTAARRRR